MAPTNKQNLIHYLEFLKESGFLFLENDVADALGAPLAPAANAAKPVTQAKRTAPPANEAPAAPPQAASKPIIPPPPPAKAAAPLAPAAEAVQTRSLNSTTVRWGLVPTREERVARLADAARRAEACRACALGSQRNKLVFADGDPMARIVFIGEAPGGEENATGIPFVGRAGQLLNKMIAAIGIKREEVYICNTLKCRPPENRDPLPSEKGACEHFLLEQLEILSPQLLIALGSHAAQYLCRSNETIGRLRGRWHNFFGIPLLATYHPAFLLRNESFKPKSWEDFKAIHAKYSELNPDDPRKLWSKKE